MLCVVDGTIAKFSCITSFILFVALPLLKNSSTLQDSEPEIEDQIAEGEKKKGKGNILLLDLPTFPFHLH